MPTFNDPSEAESKLTQLMLRAVPPNAHGNKTVTHLAKLMKVSRAAIYKWVDTDRIPPERVVQIVEIGRITGYNTKGKPIYGEQSRVDRSEFDDFVYKPL